jgi:hypothetical protein
VLAGSSQPPDKLVPVLFSSAAEVDLMVGECSISELFLLTISDTCPFDNTRSFFGRVGQI